MRPATLGGKCWIVEHIGGGGFSHESEHDLPLMVSDLLENGGGSSQDSWNSSDSESSLSDLHHLEDKISSLVTSLLLSINEADLHLNVKSGPCNASCVQFSLVKVLRLAGNDAAVCPSSWPGGCKLPRGDHEYVDVVNCNIGGSSERPVIYIDFRSHFEIARAVDSYDRILKSLPAVYVGFLNRLKQSHG